MVDHNSIKGILKHVTKLKQAHGRMSVNVMNPSRIYWSSKTQIIKYIIIV